MLVIEWIAKQYKIMVHRIDHKNEENEEIIKHIYKVHAFLVKK